MREIGHSLSLLSYEAIETHREMVEGITDLPKLGRVRHFYSRLEVALAEPMSSVGELTYRSHQPSTQTITYQGRRTHENQSEQPQEHPGIRHTAGQLIIGNEDIDDHYPISAYDGESHFPSPIDFRSDSRPLRQGPIDESALPVLRIANELSVGADHQDPRFQGSKSGLDRLGLEGNGQSNQRCNRLSAALRLQARRVGRLSPHEDAERNQ